MRLARIALPLALAIGFVVSANAAPDRAAARLEEGAAALEKGAIEEALEPLKDAAARFEQAKKKPQHIDALIRLGAAYHALGQQRLAAESLHEAIDSAREINDRPRLIAALSALGATSIYSRAAADAEASLREALKLAREEKDRAAIASVQNNLGNLLSAQERWPDAATSYREAIALGDALGAKELAAKARVSLAQNAVASGDFEKVAALNDSAVKAAAALPDSHEKAFALIRAGRTWQQLFERAPAHENARRADALRAFQKAAATATAIGDDRALSFALGDSAHLYEQEKKWDEALRLTRRASFLAQRIRSPDALYQWEWQTGRIDKAQGRIDDAIADYRRAIRSLDEIRNDLTIRLGNVNARSSFREVVGDLFFELADLLLTRADGLRDEKDIAAALHEARDTCELLKSVELEDYFQDDCVNLLQSKKRTVEAASSTAAVIYIVPLRDRTELIVSFAGKLERAKAAVGADQLTATIRSFRSHLETRSTFEFLEEAQQLYAWLIKPLEPALAQHKADTLVFVPDGALRTVPMAALHDGEKYLVEKYAVAVTPGLTLMDPQPIKRTNLSMMASGLSQAVDRDGEHFAALPFVKEEIGGLKRMFGGRTLLNREFLTGRVQQEFSQQPYSIVHIASHGEFSGDVRKTFVLTFDDRLSLDQLEKMIRPSQLREQPVELLSLSACQTAAGDDRAALGLAGVAIKAGARSAFATLWFVNDEASTALIAEFYGALHAEPTLSKAKALQRAQMKLLADPRYDHPCLWSPYLIIGNWL